MSTLHYEISPKIVNILEKANISIPRQVLTLSEKDIQKRSGLIFEDVKYLKNIVADKVFTEVCTCSSIIKNTKHYFVSVGTGVIDNLLKGGFKRGTLTELYGESGSGKTQLALQAAAHSGHKGCVFICTEDLFPVKRLDQIIKCNKYHCQDKNYGNKIFVEHCTESEELLSCVRVRLPLLLGKNNIELIVIDSVAAPFRHDSTNYIHRAEELRELAYLLITLAQKYNLSILCINQVTSAFDESSNVVPSLGLAWSNMINSRLFIKKTSETYEIDNENINSIKTHVRELSVEFSPYICKSFVKFVITTKGIENID